ncbi:hypothetical protein BASA62_002489 [Batrachochytrium salamandrivorans]|nr:hypothetical protein BASA62_002489 [Batrachochytrium salamandrivorans]
MLLETPAKTLNNIPSATAGSEGRFYSNDFSNDFSNDVFSKGNTAAAAAATERRIIDILGSNGIGSKVQVNASEHHTIQSKDVAADSVVVMEADSVVVMEADSDSTDLSPTITTTTTTTTTTIPVIHLPNRDDSDSGCIDNAAAGSSSDSKANKEVTSKTEQVDKDQDAVDPSSDSPTNSTTNSPTNSTTNSPTRSSIRVRASDGGLNAAGSSMTTNVPVRISSKVAMTDGLVAQVAARAATRVRAATRARTSSTVATVATVTTEGEGVTTTLDTEASNTKVITAMGEVDKESTTTPVIGTVVPIIEPTTPVVGTTTPVVGTTTPIIEPTTVLVEEPSLLVNAATITAAATTTTTTTTTTAKQCDPALDLTSNPYNHHQNSGPGRNSSDSCSSHSNPVCPSSLDKEAAADMLQVHRSSSSVTIAAGSNNTTRNTINTNTTTDTISTGPSSPYCFYRFCSYQPTPATIARKAYVFQDAESALPSQK